MAMTRTHFALCAAILFAGIAPVAAADLYGGSIKDAPVYAPFEAPRPTIYLRVDGGYGSYDEPSITEEHIYDLSEAALDSSWSFGGGVGMYLPRGFRADLTVDRRFEADAEGTLVQGALPGVRSFGFESTIVLANVYYDFDMGNRFTPYVGLGLGVAHNETSAGSVIDDTGAVVGTIDGASSNNVAGAAMAGVNVKVFNRMSVDLGYRFLYLGDAATGPVTDISTSTPVSGDPTVSEIHAHEFRFGLRYDIR